MCGRIILPHIFFAFLVSFRNSFYICIVSGTNCTSGASRPVPPGAGQELKYSHVFQRKGL
ncbi:TPA_asm: hypothetical protein [Porphyromonas phage phage017a_JCVISC001]|uniref:Uncharacterized protein n=1 Tax=Porphyromonas phage phage017a_JCVISC001 TaxID=3154107 RepID=A0AAT9JCR5_9CAUD